MRPLLFLLAVVLSFFLFGLVSLVCKAAFRSEHMVYRVGRAWARLCLRVGGISCEVTGVEHVPVNRTVVFCANHASQVDILALYDTLPVSIRFLAKKELFSVPFFGLVMTIAGHIPIDRSGGRAAVKSINEAAEKIRKGASVVIFPEGTRSHDGRLQAFKTGGMQVAIRSGCPIIPVAILGSYEILPRSQIWIRPGHIKVAIGEPISPLGPDGTPLSKEEVSQRTWVAISNLLNQLQKTREDVPSAQ